MDISLDDGAKSELVRVRRFHKKARYDTETLHAVLDAGCTCHIAYVLDGLPVVTPTLYWREGDFVYWHGSAASRTQEKSAGTKVCFSVTHFDGFILARCAFDHSVHYRSAILFGVAEPVDPREKEARMLYMMETYFPGRWSTLRPLQENELKATTVLRLRIDEASVKISGNEPRELSDGSQPCWAGVLPVKMIVGEPRPSTSLPKSINVPGHVSNFDILRPQNHST